MVIQKKHRSVGLLFLTIIALSMALNGCSAFRDAGESGGAMAIRAEDSGSEPSGSEPTVPPAEPSAAAAGSDSSSKILVAYFSRVGVSESFDGVDIVSSASLPDGNTITVANMIAAAMGRDLFQILTKKLYPAGYEEATEVAAQERDSDERPALKSHVENWDSYDTIFLGYPNWWGTCPMAVFSFLEEYDFSGKTIIPFCTHGGSHLGTSEKDIAALCPEATLLPGLALRGSDVNSARGEVEEWLGGLGLSA